MSEPSSAAAGFTDVSADGWADRWVPATARPYVKLARLDRPIGTWLLLFPCWWSTALAADGWPSIRLLVLFAVGAVVMRGAGCTVNDILDRDIDGEVERTRVRPIPSGQVSVRQALVFLVLQLLLGLAVLVQMNGPTILLGAASLILVFTYPLMKRITWWPQAFLGLAFNWGALMGWSAVHGSLALPPALLYAAGIAWTLGYDTIYAHQDKEDDARIGVKSTARLFGRSSRAWVGGFHALAVLGIALSGITAGLAWPFLALTAVAASFLAWHTLRWSMDDQADCLFRFKTNRWFGWLILAAFIAGRVAA
jgi:4-hydroxybenzoate polyprenyltransferase